MNWLSPKSIAKKLDMSPKTILRMLERRELPHVEFSSGRKRVSEEALERFLKKAEKKGRSDTNAPTKANPANSDSESRLSAVQSSDHDRKSA